MPKTKEQKEIAKRIKKQKVVTDKEIKKIKNKSLFSNIIFYTLYILERVFSIFLAYVLVNIIYLIAIIKFNAPIDYGLYIYKFVPVSVAENDGHYYHISLYDALNQYFNYTCTSDMQEMYQRNVAFKTLFYENNIKLTQDDYNFAKNYVYNELGGQDEIEKQLKGGQLTNKAIKDMIETNAKIYAYAKTKEKIDTETIKDWYEKNIKGVHPEYNKDWDKLDDKEKESVKYLYFDMVLKTRLLADMMDMIRQGKASSVKRINFKGIFSEIF